MRRIVRGSDGSEKIIFYLALCCFFGRNPYDGRGDWNDIDAMIQFLHVDEKKGGKEFGNNPQNGASRSE